MTMNETGGYFIVKYPPFQQKQYIQIQEEMYNEKI